MERSLRAHIEQLRSQLEADHKAHEMLLNKQREEQKRQLRLQQASDTQGALIAYAAVGDQQKQTASAMHRERALRKSNEEVSLCHHWVWNNLLIAKTACHFYLLPVL